MILALTQTVIILFWREEKLFNFLCGLLWLPLFTLAVLVYRFFYKTRQWNQLNTGKNILVVVGYSLLAGLAVSILMLGLVIPLFWSDVEKIAIENNISISTIFSQLVLTNWFQTQLFIASWVFIYISIVTRQLVKQTELTNLRLQNSLKESQLANLSNQLNPHFLFNTLNNIKFMVRKEPLKSEKMITDLSDILRYSLESNKREKVTIADELEIVNRYIDIIKIQMERRLDFEMILPEHLQANLIPPMILQLLVENAIKHGVDSLRHGGKVQLTLEDLPNHIRVVVLNDTPGSETARVIGTGIGLANIKQRLLLLYGNLASFQVNQTGAMFSVTLTIPKELL